ncbi:MULTISPECIES: alpha/beta fold hydrolase [unclassified Janthinobacterium]|uniref:alpha/beta fold hydrolase n=1 Tax=unclassified Janthinobacterium TaxID=2610881 RepID=UPI00034D79DD|nr:MULTISPECIES: alpha/beta fold hydrolase [unclassified Janthinobacterium]MEC5161202.1 dienelactone hydrolase [Janthinobacterium sp. CG_S6]
MIEVSLGFGDGLVGTLCLPVTAGGAGHGATAGIILFNAGIVHRIGPHRLNVRLARALAGRGIASIRFDLAGLGDSRRADGSVGFEAQAVADLRAAMTALGQATGLRRFGLFGFCSGGFHSYNAAQRDERVAGILLFEAYRYATLKTKLIRLSMRLRQHGVAPTIARLGAALLRRMAGRRPAADSAEPLARALGVGYTADSPAKAAFAQGLRVLLERQVDVGLIYAGDGFEFYNYEAQFRDAFKRFGITERVKATFLPDIDHVVTGSAAQRALIEHVLPWSAMVAGLAPAPRTAVASAPATAKSAAADPAA